MKPDVTNPSHYKSHSSGVECITVTERMSFCGGNAVKYVWRAGLKTPNPTEDYAKALWYVRRELRRQEARNPNVRRWWPKRKPPMNVDFRALLCHFPNGPAHVIAAVWFAEFQRWSDPVRHLKHAEAHLLELTAKKGYTDAKLKE